MILEGQAFLSVGETARLGDLRVRAIEDPFDSCLNCCLQPLANCQILFGECEEEYRPDHKCIIFIKDEENETDE